MVTNKETVKALNAATTLVEYCNKIKLCNDCVFYKSGLNECCAVKFPYDYREVNK